MREALQQLVNFFAQKHHVPIHLFSEPWEVEDHKFSLLVSYPQGAEQQATIGNMEVLLQSDYMGGLGGRVISIDTVPVLCVGDSHLIFLFNPVNDLAEQYMKQMLDLHLPMLAIQYRRKQRKLFVDKLEEYRHSEVGSIENRIYRDEREVASLSNQIAELSAGMAMNRNLLAYLNQDKSKLERKATRTFHEVYMLVPGLYSFFRYEKHAIIGRTQPITIRHDGQNYYFDPYEVKADLADRRVCIYGLSNEKDGYIHPHVTNNEDGICWGNIGSTVHQLIGQLDLLGLFQLVHNFLSSYNENDPYLRIEHWDPDYCEDEDNYDQPYCSLCDEYGHSDDNCDWFSWCETCQEHHHVDESCPAEAEEEVPDEQVAA